MIYEYLIGSAVSTSTFIPRVAEVTICVSDDHRAGFACGCRRICAFGRPNAAISSLRVRAPGIQWYRLGRSCLANCARFLTGCIGFQHTAIDLLFLTIKMGGSNDRIDVFPPIYHMLTKYELDQQFGDMPQWNRSNWDVFDISFDSNRNRDLVMKLPELAERKWL